MNADQRLINESWAHLQKTGFQSMDTNGDCKYGGSGCALSVMIKPDHIKYFDELTASCSDLLSEQNKLFEWAAGVNQKLAYKLQVAHDDYKSEDDDNDDFLYDIATNYLAACKTFELTPPESMLEYIKQNESTD